MGNLTTVRGEHNITTTHNHGDNNTTHNYYQKYSRTKSGLSVLRSQVAFSALHDSEARYPQPNVLHGTREEILQKLSYWVEDPFKKNKVYWINGAAGVGKSAIAQALSEKYTQTGQLAAAFFFSRNDSTRDKLDPFVATITYQLATSDALKPFIAPLIDHTIRSIPGIFHKTCEDQFQTLIEEPFAQVDPKHWFPTRLVIIDGIDECINVGSQKRLLRILQNATPTLILDFLVFSRPEPHISHIFRHKSFIPSPLQMALGDFVVRDDIEKYLRSEFARIREEHWDTLPSPQASWPGDTAICQLLHKATGQFIYATTVIKHIDAGKVPVTPVQRLEIILHAEKVNSSSPYPDLDLLYSQILQFCVNEGGKLQKILRLIVSPFHVDHNTYPFRLCGLPLVGLQSLWALEQLLELSQGEAAVLLSGLHSIIDIPPSKTENVVVRHASFSDFLLDQYRADVYYVGTRISPPKWSQLLVARQLQILQLFYIEFEHRPMHSQDHTINGIHSADIGSHNVWKYMHDNQGTIAINDEIAAALNAFDPHLYLAMLLHWNYKYDNSDGYKLSRFPVKSQDWRRHTTVVHYQISMFYSVFRFLKKLDKSSRRSLQKFLIRCSSFFRGFYVSFPRDQDNESVQYTLLACQLSISRLDTEFLPFVPYLKPNFCRFDVPLRIVPCDDGDRRNPTIPARWDVKYINPAEGRLFCKLLELPFQYNPHHKVDLHFLNFFTSVGTRDIFASSQLEDWTYELARLDWGKTWKTYLSGKLVQLRWQVRSSNRPYSNGDITSH